MEILISLVMIVRNEETHLQKCLESICSEVDEIIIVDTGSTDQTREVAFNYTDKVYTFPWNHDFSAARNFALQKASGQWTLSLDADEYLVSKPGELRSLVLANTAIEAYLLPLHNPTSETTEEYNLFQVLRLFRNNGIYRFAGQIHEQVVISKEHVIDIASSPIIYHQYLPLKERHRKRERNLKALRRSLSTDPQNPFLHYYTGVEWMMLNKPSKALPYLQTSYQSLPAEMLTFRTSALRYLVIALHSLGDASKALEFVLEGNAQYPHYADLLYLGGISFREIQEYTQAVKWLKEALASGSPPCLYSHLTGTESFLAYYQLGLCYERLGELNQAQEAYLASLQANPSYVFPLYPLMSLAIDQRGPRQTLAFLSQQNLLFHPVQALIAAQIFFMIGYPNLALECLKNSTDSTTPPVEYTIALGKYLLFSGEIHAALQVFNSLYKQNLPFSSPSSPSSQVGLSSSNVEIRLYLLLTLLLSGNFPRARSIALELWRNAPTRCEGYAFIALIEFMEKEKKLPLPRVIRDRETSLFLKLLYQDLLHYLPPTPHHPNTLHKRLIEGLQILLKTSTEDGIEYLEGPLKVKSSELRNQYQRKFGTGWIIS